MGPAHSPVHRGVCYVYVTTYLIEFGDLIKYLKLLCVLCHCHYFKNTLKNLNYVALPTLIEPLFIPTRSL